MTDNLLKYTGEVKYEIELEDWFVQMMEDADTEDRWPITSTVYFEGRSYDLLYILEMHFKQVKKWQEDIPSYWDEVHENQKSEEEE